jgi:hypothetical protein
LILKSENRHFGASGIRRAYFVAVLSSRAALAARKRTVSVRLVSPKALWTSAKYRTVSSLRCIVRSGTRLRDDLRFWITRASLLKKNLQRPLTDTYGMGMFYLTAEEIASDPAPGSEDFMIYFVQDSDNLHIKIGYAADSEGRIASLQTGNPNKLILLLEIDGDRAAETEFHRRHAEHRVAGEWFRPSPGLILEILEKKRLKAWWVGHSNGAVAQQLVNNNREKFHDSLEYARLSRVAGDQTAIIKWCLSGSDTMDDVNIRCPNCGYDYTHIERAGTLTGSDEYEAVKAYPGTESIGVTGSRRSAIKVVMSCEECPTLFGLIIQQDKGVNFLSFDKDCGLRKPPANADVGDEWHYFAYPT